jgi:hypothetical protein
MGWLKPADNRGSRVKQTQYFVFSVFFVASSPRWLRGLSQWLRQS